MTGTIWIGVDPGARHTGVTVRAGRDYLWHAVTTRLDQDVPGYLAAVSQTMQAAADVAHASGGAGLWAVEATGAPKWFMNGKATPVRPVDLIAVAMVEGWVLNEATALGGNVPPVRVKAGKNGSQALSTYPKQLVTAAEASRRNRTRTWHQPAGKSADINHARSAWDIAGTAALLARTNRQGALALGGVR